MLIKHNTIIIGAALLVSAGIWMVTWNKKAAKAEILSARVFHSERGWGYDILVNDTIFIHQESVPGISYNKGFPRREQAEEITRLIINKMKRGQRPAVTTFELGQIFPANERVYDQSRSSQ